MYVNDGDTHVEKVARGAWRVPPTRASFFTLVSVSACVCVANDDDGTHRREEAWKRHTRSRRVIDRPSLSSSRSVDAVRFD
jgi:hypothetical protein